MFSGNVDLVCSPVDFNFDFFIIIATPVYDELLHAGSSLLMIDSFLVLLPYILYFTPTLFRLGKWYYLTLFLLHLLILPTALVLAIIYLERSRALAFIYIFGNIELNVPMCVFANTFFSSSILHIFAVILSIIHYKATGIFTYMREVCLEVVEWSKEDIAAPTTVNPAVNAWASGVSKSSSSLPKTFPSLPPPSIVLSDSGRLGITSPSSRMESSPPSARPKQDKSNDMSALLVTEAALELLSHHVPLVGGAIELLSRVLSQVKAMNRAAYDSQNLCSRLERLRSAVLQAGNDEGFVSRHESMFTSLVSSLNSLAEVVVRISERSSFQAFLLSTLDMKTLEKTQGLITTHLIDFQTALQSETLSAVRVLGSSTSPRAPPPPFGMSFGLRDFLLDPPLDVQLKTGPRGSFGVCVFGTWRAQGIPVAIKLLPAAEGAGLNAWLEEAELMRRLRGTEETSSPNVVLLYGIGYDAPYYLVVMEKLDCSLRSALDGYSRSKRSPALSTALGWLRDTARGMQACHAVNVCHSDIKAANVLLSESRAAKLGDLGTARLTRGLDATATRISATYSGDASRGSPLWTAPELIEDPSMQVSKACDVFSWALLAFEILTCLLPYHNQEGEMTVNLEKLNSKIDFVKGTLRPDLSLVRSDTPPSLVAIMQQAWASDPLGRPSADHLVEMLEKLLPA